MRFALAFVFAPPAILVGFGLAPHPIGIALIVAGLLIVIAFMAAIILGGSPRRARYVEHRGEGYYAKQIEDDRAVQKFMDMKSAEEAERGKR